MIRSVLLTLALSVTSGHAFVLPSPSTSSSLPGAVVKPTPATALGALDDLSSIPDKIQASIKIAQESNAAGYGFKQVVADVLAGDDYDADQISQEIEATINSAPCVMYTWENSPSCKKAVEAFEVIGATPKIVRLDDPWDRGNPIRAVLGRKYGRTSVPFVFVGGTYIGGFDGGLEENPDAGGMVDLAFRGKLREMLAEAGAMN